jgi:hypothetical protein
VFEKCEVFNFTNILIISIRFINEEDKIIYMNEKNHYSNERKYLLKYLFMLRYIFFLVHIFVLIVLSINVKIYYSRDLNLKIRLFFDIIFIF